MPVLKKPGLRGARFSNKTDWGLFGSVSTSLGALPPCPWLRDPLRFRKKFGFWTFVLHLVELEPATLVLFI